MLVLQTIEGIVNYCGQVYTQVHRGQHYGYGVGHMVKDLSDGEKGNRCRHMGYSLRLAAREGFICTIPHRVAHNAAVVTPVVEH